jgi:hypothetical protein
MLDVRWGMDVTIYLCKSVRPSTVFWIRLQEIAFTVRAGWCRYGTPQPRSAFRPPPISGARG